MYAIIETGGKQYRVAEGDVLTVEKLAVEDGAQVELDKVLLLSKDGDVQVGAPYIDARFFTSSFASAALATLAGALPSNDVILIIVYGCL